MDQKKLLKQLYRIDPELAKMVGTLMTHDQKGLPDDRSITDIPKQELYDVVQQQGVVELNSHHKLVQCPKDPEAVCSIHNRTCTGPIMEPDPRIGIPGGGIGLSPGKVDPSCPYSPGTGDAKDLL